MTDDEINRAIAEKLEPLDASAWVAFTISPLGLWWCDCGRKRDVWQPSNFCERPAAFFALWRALHAAGWEIYLSQDEVDGVGCKATLHYRKVEGTTCQVEGSDPMLALRDAAAKAMGMEK